MELMQNWKPWLKTKGAKTVKGRAKSKMNTYKHGISETKVL